MSSGWPGNVGRETTAAASHSEELFDGGRVQSFGDIVQEAIDVFGDGKGASALTPIITSEQPSVECRGTDRFDP